MKRFIILILVVTSIFQKLSHGTEIADQSKKPNIVILLGDDLGFAYPGFTGGLAETPNLNALAKVSLNFTQFYVSPVCTPSRAALLTGRYPFQTGTEQRFDGADISGMLKDERTLAQALKDAGYYTAIFGKWHLGEWQTAHLPQSRGFDYQFGFYGAMVDYYRKVRISGKSDAGYAEDVPFGSYTYDWHRNGQPLVQDGYSTYLIADEVDSVLSKRDQSKPFFFYVAFNATHSPSDKSQVPPEYRDKSKKVKYTQAFCMDQSIGKVISSLKAHHEIDNTILIFLNDNGAAIRPGDTDNAPWRGGKGEFYEGGVRVPCLISWPARIHQTKNIDALLDVVDFYPTLLNIAGGSLNQPLPISGKDFTSLLTGEATTVRDEIPLSLHAIRKGDWKFIDKDALVYGEGKANHEKKASIDELYNIKEDPGETHNVADQNQDKVQELKGLLAQYSKEARPAEPHARIPVHQPPIYGEEEAKKFPGVVFDKKDGSYTIKLKQ
jgi:arylsulfatase A-like enzyme